MLNIGGKDMRKVINGLNDTLLANCPNEAMYHNGGTINDAKGKRQQLFQPLCKSQ